MKKILFVSLTLIFAFAGLVYASGVNGQYKGNNVVRVQYEGRTLTPDDVPGQMIDGRTMVPIGILRKAGFTVDWDAQKLTANITTKKPEEPKTPLTVDQVKELSNAVAIVYALDDNGKRFWQGSGFIVNGRGLLLTANHVPEVDGKLHALDVEVNGKLYKVPAGVYVFADEQKDIFGVYLQDPEPFPFLKISQYGPKNMDHGYTISSPKGERNVITEGYFTANFKQNGMTTVSGMFNTLRGSSGGALLNIFGDVVGVITSGGAEGSGITISTGIRDVKDLYENSYNK